MISSPKILFLPLILLLFSCNSQLDEQAKNKQNLAKDIPDNEIWNLYIKITEEGRLKADIKAGYVKRKNTNIANYSENDIDSGLVITFFENGFKKGMLTSNKGRIEDRKGIFKASENVHFQSPKGYDLYTELLIWNRKRKRIYTDQKVLFISSEGDTLYGDGFETDDKLNNFTLENPMGKKVLKNEEKEAGI